VAKRLTFGAGVAATRLGRGFGRQAAFDTIRVAVRASIRPSLALDQCINGPGGVVETYGQKVVDRINCNRGRILPSFQGNASTGADLYKSEKFNLHFHADGEDLSDALDVIYFSGLIGPSRGFALRLRADC
jgi:hypothetical protein